MALAGPAGQRKLLLGLETLSLLRTEESQTMNVPTLSDLKQALEPRAFSAPSRSNVR
jgi:hypothetical protein